MSQFTKGETFTDVSPGKTVTSTRLNAHVDNATLLNGAVLDQQEKTITVAADTVLLGDSTLASSALPKKVQLSNLLPETIRQSVPQYADDTGGANTYVMTLAPAATAYTKGMVVRFKVGNANTGASTLNVNALGAKAIKTRSGGDPAANDLLVGQLVEAYYDGTNFQISSIISAGEITATHTTENLRTGENQYAVDTGAANAYACAPTPAITGYTVGLVVRFKAVNANTTASTLAVNGLATKSIVRNDGTSALRVGDILAGQMVNVVYDGTNFQLVNSSGTITSFTAVAIPAAGSVVTTAHGLGARPKYVRVTLYCDTADTATAFGTGDEIELFAANVPTPGFLVYADATNVSVVRSNSGIFLPKKSTGVNTAVTGIGNFSFRIYVSL